MPLSFATCTCSSPRGVANYELFQLAQVSVSLDRELNSGIKLKSAWRNDYIALKYRLTFLTFFLKPQFSVLLSLFYRTTKETEIIY